MVRNSKLLFFSVSLCFIITFNSCKQKQIDLPYAYVNRNYSIYDPAFSSLQAIGGSAFIEYEGVSGIIVYRKSLEEIVAYEANCTYQPDDLCGVRITEFNNEAIDSTCCGSKFQLYDGSPIEGPASLALYKYKVIFNTDDFTITNF